MPRYCGFLRFAAIPRATKADLQLLWKQWMQEHLAVSGGLLPPGNVRGNSQWSRRKHLPPKINILLTNGVNSQVNDSTVFQLCREIVESYNIVAFIKGTRKEPECGFSYRVCAILEELSVDFETVDTLDERHNHNLRNVLKDFSDWPTIPQVYYRGSLLGGHDIIEDLYKSGQLKHILVPGSTAEAA